MNANVSDRIKLFDTAMKPAQQLITDDFHKYLELNEFFTAPASTEYPNDYEGALFDHSLEVTKKLVVFTELFNLTWDRPESPYIVGMFHDLCKIDQYKIICIPSVTQGILPTYKVALNDDLKTFLEGHGEKSVMLLSEYIHLTRQEIMCIRYHMGDSEKKDSKIFPKIAHHSENVFWTHIADKHTNMVGDGHTVYDDIFFKTLGL